MITLSRKSNLLAWRTLHSNRFMRINSNTCYDILCKRNHRNMLLFSSKVNFIKLPPLIASTAFSLIYLFTAGDQQADGNTNPSSPHQQYEEMKGNVFRLRTTILHNEKLIFDLITQPCLYSNFETLLHCTFT